MFFPVSYFPSVLNLMWKRWNYRCGKIYLPTVAEGQEYVVYENLNLPQSKIRLLHENIWTPHKIFGQKPQYTIKSNNNIIWQSCVTLMTHVMYYMETHSPYLIHRMYQWRTIDQSRLFLHLKAIILYLTYLRCSIFFSYREMK